jgi:N-acetylneuraminate synthase
MQTSSAQPVFIIAEIGINHNGDLRIAKELMAMAKRVGCDAVKFQKRSPDLCVPEAEKAKVRETPWGQMTYLEYRHRTEFSENEYGELDAYASKVGISWSASAWDIESQLFLRHFNVPFNKVASAMITNLEFLRTVAAEKKITYVSTGMCGIKDIDEAVKIFRANECPVVLMHTVSTYPAPEETLNLSLIPYYVARYGLPVGYSGHESSVSPTVMAVALGAVAVERHVTLDRTMWGTDQAASLEERGLRELVTQIRKFQVVFGEPIKRLLPSEEAVKQKLVYW